MSEPDDVLDAELDRISSTFQSEQRRERRRTLALSLIPIAIGALVVASAWLGVSRARDDLKRVNGDLARASVDLQGARQQRVQLEVQTRQLEEKIAEGQAELEYIASLLAQGQEKLAAERSEAAAREMRSTGPEALTGEAKARVYIHLSDRSQMRIVERIAAGLRQEGFWLPKEAIVVDAAPSSSQVRYFRRAEGEEAEAIARLLRDGSGLEIQAAYIRGFEQTTAIRPRHYEVWLARGS